MGRGGDRFWGRGVASLAVLAASACVGATDREDFEAEIEARGGGFSEATVLDAVAGVAEEVGSGDFAISHLTVSPLTPIVAVQVRDPRAPGQLDDYTFRGDELVEVRPVRVSAGTDLDATTVPIDDFALDQLDEVVDAALAAFDVADGYATTVRLGVTSTPTTTGASGPPVGTIAVDVESDRAAATVRFDADGALLGVDPR